MLRTKLLISTAYYPKTNGLLERTNQTIGIVLRFFITLKVSWSKALPTLQFVFMNTSNAVKGALFN